MSIIVSAATKASRVLFDATQGHPAPRTFGRGVIPRPGQHDGRKPFTQEDLDWAAQAFGEAAIDWDFDADHEPDFDAMAYESASQDALELGLIPTDLAEYLSETSLVGLPEETTADDILHAGSQPDACNCYPCLEHRTRHYAQW
jgi:hypothetical protein